MSNVVLFPSVASSKPAVAKISPRVAFDDVLVERIAAGDVEAAANLKARYWRRLFAIAETILSDETEAARVVEATFEEACAGWPPERGQVERWLTRLVRKEARAWRDVLSGIAA